MKKSYTFGQTLWFTLSALLLVTACIGEDMSSCAQYSVVTKVVDEEGNQIPTSSVRTLKAYLFLNGKFSEVLTSDANGRFNIAFESNTAASLVVLGATDSDCVAFHAPQKGEDIGNISLELTGNKEGSADTKSRVYYGRYDYAAQDRATNQSILLVVKNQQARICVVVKHLQAAYGNDNNYRVSLSGFRNALTFYGKPRGELIEYTPEVRFNASNHLESDAVNTFPTQADDHVEVSVYSGGTLLLQSDEDGDGNAISLAAGDDKVLVLDCSQPGMQIQVVSWGEYTQEIIMP